MGKRFKQWSLVIVLSAFFMSWHGWEGIAKGQSTSDSFHRHFEKSKTIQVPAEIPVGQISFMDVNADGEILLTDRVGRSVILIDSEGNLKKTLTPEGCDENISWRPTEAYFASDGSVFVVGAQPWGIRFSEDGECISQASSNYLAADATSFDDQGYMYGYYEQGHQVDNGFVIKKMTPQGRTTFEFPLAGGFKRMMHLNYRLADGGMVYGGDGSLYVTFPTEPEVFVYSQQGELIRTIQVRPPFFDDYQSDIESIDEVHETISRKTVSHSLFLLEKDKLLVQYFDKQNDLYWTTVCSLDGQVLTDPKYIRVPGDIRRVEFSSHGKAYGVRQPAPNEAGNLPNPIIVEYLFVPE